MIRQSSSTTTLVAQDQLLLERQTQSVVRAGMKYLRNSHLEYDESRVK